MANTVSGQLYDILLKLQCLMLNKLNKPSSLVPISVAKNLAILVVCVLYAMPNGWKQMWSTTPKQGWLPLCTLESTAFKTELTISKATSFRTQLPEDKFGGILETRV